MNLYLGTMSFLKGKTIILASSLIDRDFTDWKPLNVISLVHRETNNFN